MVFFNLIKFIVNRLFMIILVSVYCVESEFLSLKPKKQKYQNLQLRRLSLTRQYYNTVLDRTIHFKQANLLSKSKFFEISVI